MHPQSTLPPYTCAHCGVVFAPKRYSPGILTYCSRACYYAFRRALPLSEAERFQAKVNQDGPVLRPELGACWVWTGKPNRGGYGTLNVRGRGPQLAHRMAWEMTHGGIPDGLFVLHKCDNPPCVRLDHLFLGTTMDNMADAKQKGRMASGDRHRSKRHPESVLRGEQLPHAKLTADEVREIRRLIATGVRLTELGPRFGVTYEAIRSIRNQRTWRGV